MNFKEFLSLCEGGFIADEKAEVGKSRVKNPPVRGPSAVTPSGVSGGPGGAGGTAGSVPIQKSPTPSK